MVTYMDEQVLKIENEGRFLLLIFVVNRRRRSLEIASNDFNEQIEKLEREKAKEEEKTYGIVIKCLVLS